MAEELDQKDEEVTEKEVESEQPTIKKATMTRNYIALLTVFSTIILVASYFISPFSKIQKVVIHGNDGVVAQEILVASDLKIEQSIFDVRGNEAQIAQRIEKLQQVKNAKVKLVHWNEVKIDITEYKTVAYLSEDDTYLRVLENGVILEDKYLHSIGNQPVIINFEEGKALDRMIKELEKIDDNVLRMISEIEYLSDHSNPMFVQVYMNNGNRVLASIPEFSKNMEYYPQMAQAVGEKKGIFDMEVGVYFIPFSQHTNAAGELEYYLDEEGEYYGSEEEAYAIESPFDEENEESE